MNERDDLDQALLRTAVRVDALRAAGLRGLERVTQARQAGLERERERLDARLGPEHPRTRSVGERIEAGTARLRALRVEVARAEVVSPEPGADQWVLHGHVRREDQDPAPDLTVSLVDRRGRWIEALGFDCTDAQGYFRIATRVGKPEATDRAGAEREAYIRVAGRDRVELYRSGEAVTVDAGRVEYREITLVEGRAGCAPPEDEAGPEPPARGTKPPDRTTGGRKRKR